MGSGEAKKFRAQYGSAGRHGAAFWTEESDNVGMKLLKGMGWQDGQGLGKTGQGNTSLVKQFRKNDNAGIGGNAGTRDDAFRASQDLFAGVLARLNGGSEEEAGASATTAPSLGSAADSISGHLAKGQLSRRFTRGANGGVGVGMKDTANYGSAATQHGQSAPLAGPQLGSCASSGCAWRLWPLPRILERARSTVADSTSLTIHHRLSPFRRWTRSSADGRTRLKR